MIDTKQLAKQSLLPVPSQRRSGEKNLGVKFIVAHDTGTVNADAKNNASYYTTSCYDMQASAHYFVDDIGAICCIPEDEKAWHVRYTSPVDNQLYGGDANDISLGIELCYFADLKRSKNAYTNYVALIAILCSKYGIEPSRGIVGHSKLDPTRRTDPENAFNKIGKTWKIFIDDVTKHLKSMTA